jgi:hypothetical protein
MLRQILIVMIERPGMICCLLALLAALPGLSMLRRNHLGRGHCTVHRSHITTGHAAARQITIAAGLAFAVTLGLLTVGISGIVSHPLGPICSAIDRATLVR